MLNALMIADSSSSEDSKEKSDDSDDEAMLSRKLQRILAKKKKFGSKRFFKKDKKKEPTCYECNQPGHYKSKYPKLKKKDQAERSDKKKEKEKKFRKFKKKAMAATWDNEEATSSESSSSEFEEEEKANLALMAGLEQKPIFLFEDTLSNLVFNSLVFFLLFVPLLFSGEECDHELFLDELHVPSSSQVVQQEEEPVAEDRMEEPETQVRSEAPVQIQEQEDQFHLSSSILEQDAPEETINEVLRNIRGKGVAYDDVPVATEFEEREHHSSPSQFETRPRSQGDNSNSFNSIMDLLSKQQENLSVLQLQVEFIDAKFDVEEKEPESQAEQQQPVKDQSQQAEQQPKEQKDQEPEPQELSIVVFQQKSEQQEILENPPLAAAVEVEQKKKEPQQESRPKRSLEDVSKPKVKTFKRKVKRRLIKDGEPVFPSPFRPTPPIPTPSVELPPEPKKPTPSHPQPTAPSSPTSSSTQIPPPSASSDPPPLASIPGNPFHQDIKFEIYPMKYQFKPSKAHIHVLHTQPPHYFSSLPTASKSGKSLLHLAEILPSIQLSSSRGPNGTGVYGFPTLQCIRGPGWFFLWALDPVEV
ncbi:hypothetical protein Taro_054538 [Colocasia esculenta]|uniref:Uncharacterized protein n=1 Tax=Colocasia esculenta TaxID=4460 RepID=A0A843XQB6_COLES|nr:hypothetical protein [Colocasia esculenta]